MERRVFQVEEGGFQYEISRLQVEEGGEGMRWRGNGWSEIEVFRLKGDGKYRCACMASLYMHDVSESKLNWASSSKKVIKLHVTVVNFLTSWRQRLGH